MTDLVFLAGSHEAKQKAAIDSKLSGAHTHSVSEVNGLEAQLNEKAQATHTHGISSVNGLQTALDAKNPIIVAGTHINDAPTNAPNNAPTNLNPATMLLANLTGEMNATNGKQNQTADNLNVLATRFNTLLDRLETTGILQP